MKILVANLGSTSFKYRLFIERDGELQPVAKGGFERVTDHAEAISKGLDDLRAQGHLEEGESLDAVGFKTVLGHNLSGCVRADSQVIEALEQASDLAPAHNPAYAAGIRQFQKIMPEAVLVALFETAFYQWTSEAYRRYAIPESWFEAGLQRYGFHGASHKFVAERSAALLDREDIADRVRALYHGSLAAVDGPPLRIISCHLGGSSSVTGIRNGLAIGTSMGLSPQSGLPQNNRVGDLDSMAVPFAIRKLGLTLDEVERVLTKESGLLGMSGVSNDMRDIREAAKEGNARARLARDHFIQQIRHWVGAFWIEMGGLDALVFTAGIGENDPELRAAVCEGLDEMGLRINPALNSKNLFEQNLAAPGSKVKVFVIPANEEAVVAEETRRFVRNHS